MYIYIYINIEVDIFFFINIFFIHFDICIIPERYYGSAFSRNKL